MTCFIYEMGLRYTRSFASDGKALLKALWRIKCLRRQKPISSEQFESSR